MDIRRLEVTQLGLLTLNVFFNDEDDRLVYESQGNAEMESLFKGYGVTFKR